MHAGMDLNRVWQDPSPKLHPTLWAMKQLLRDFSAERELVLFCDLHGHSCRHDVFAYGCEKKQRDSRPFQADWPLPGEVRRRWGQLVALHSVSSVLRHAGQQCCTPPAELPRHHCIQLPINRDEITGNRALPLLKYRLQGRRA